MELERREKLTENMDEIEKQHHNVTMHESFN